ncbi:DUF5954 family protein [Streptomyces sp. NPDC093094]|uniref:DUF5954 family protein n=1 Tax=Streptomyces sp. NPDC093094 TaxID=3366026 RepID=UPI003803E751
MLDCLRPRGLSAVKSGNSTGHAWSKRRVPCMRPGSRPLGSRAAGCCRAAGDRAGRRSGCGRGAVPAIRAEEYAVAGPDEIEGPRQTDPELPVPDWTRAAAEPPIDDGLKAVP